MNKKNNKFSKSLLLTVFLILISVVVYASNNTKDESDVLENKAYTNYIDETDNIEIIEVDEKDYLASGDVLVNDSVVEEYNEHLKKDKDKTEEEKIEKGATSVVITKEEEKEIKEIQKKNIKKIKNNNDKKKTSSSNKSVKIGMPREHQDYLFDLCKERNLDYKKVLAIIALESNFNSQLISETGDYGYMQVNKCNHARMVETLRTKNAPLDPYVNLNWGTYLLSELYDKWRAEGISDKTNEGEVFSELDKYVMSSYNKGISGFKKHGMASRYISLAEGRYRNIAK